MENKNKISFAQIIADEVETKEQLTKDIEELNEKLVKLCKDYKYNETQEEYLILDKLYQNFLKAKRKLLNSGKIELTKKVKDHKIMGLKK